MTDFQIEVLSKTYQNYLNGDNYNGFQFQNLTSNEKTELFNSLDYLAEKKLIQYTTRALGYVEFKLSAHGIDFVENDFHEPENPSVVTQGSNSIYIHGSGNTVTENYNRLTMEINNSDLPQECKDLINTFLYELKNPHLTSEKKVSKIKQFLSEITANSLTDAATSSLTVLLTSLFDKIPF